MRILNSIRISAAKRLHGLSDLCNLQHLYADHGDLDRAMPADVEQAIMQPGSSLHDIAFGSFAGLDCCGKSRAVALLLMRLEL